MAVPDPEDVSDDGGGRGAARVVEAAAVPEGRVRVAFEEEEAEGRAEARADGRVHLALLLKGRGILEARAALPRAQVARVVARVEPRVAGGAGAGEHHAEGLSGWGGWVGQEFEAAAVARKVWVVLHSCLLYYWLTFVLQTNSSTPESGVSGTTR